jgi:hypothetical protein
MSAVLRKREAIELNLWPAAAALAVLLVGGLGAIAIKADRAAPLAFTEGHIAPQPAAPGSVVTVNWINTWLRVCEGELSRQLIGSDGVVRAYRKHFLRVPVNLGTQRSETRFRLPPSFPQGPAVYEGLIRFRDCGMTSRIWPLEVRVPELRFSVGP